MAILPTNYCHDAKQQGLTLIEVLIALAIVSIAMTAIIKAVTQNIRSTGYLQDKTIALYVGQQVLNEARVGLLSFAPGVEKINEKTQMLDRKWYWRLTQTQTPNPRIKKINVHVYAHDAADDNETPLISLESYL